VAITTHHKPDGDALGSSLALSRMLNHLGHRATVVSPCDWPSFLNWLPGAADIIDFEASTQGAKKVLSEAELLFCLDFNDLGRIYRMGDVVRGLSCPVVMIDHHTNPTEFDYYRYHDDAASSTCELVYRLANEAGWEAHIDAAAAECLYCGTMTDTGSFKFPSTTAAVHRMVADLIDRGADHYKVHSQVYDQMGAHVLRFLGYCFTEKLRLLPGYSVAYFAITAEEVRRFGLQTGDTEGLVHYALNIEGVRMAALIIDRHERVKMSFRSRGPVPVQEFARKWFDGGGHYHAAGGQSSDSLERTEQRFLEAIPEFVKLWGEGNGPSRPAKTLAGFGTYASGVSETIEPIAPVTNASGVSATIEPATFDPSANSQPNPKRAYEARGQGHANAISPEGVGNQPAGPRPD